MLRDCGPVWQAFLGSLFTWGLTALGAACVWLLASNNRRFLDGSLGFAAGVMTAASFWSLLAPAIEMTESELGSFAFIPVSIGFIFGAAFVAISEKLLPYFGVNDASIVQMLPEKNHSKGLETDNNNDNEKKAKLNLRRRKKRQSVREDEDAWMEEEEWRVSWRRMFLLLVAITVHNIPEGLAVGVGFGAVGRTSTATFESARNLALGIGIQNFPEGLAVSLPLAGFGYSKLRSFWWGQLSGAVEPAAAVLGAAAVSLMEPVLPYALSFAAGAMIFVVVDDIIPEARSRGNGGLASWGAVLGFVLMMALDVGLG